ncbi:RAMP superfamily CRISPR-associated protein [Actinokineospora sp. G85]|uniref:RAMP superfamily CRISPR-associated protein n=1 Tax=Actinokineospora sp. G85 TaxID=3406626 RepID=UPI003C7273B7
MTPTPLAAVSQVRVRTLSDWHVGAGIGTQGELNALIRRDPDALPYLPGTTLTGLLRESCLRLVHGLDNADPAGPWYAWHRHLFGNRQNDSHEPRPAAVSIRAARVSEGLAAALRGHPHLLDATTFRKPGVAIDPETGRAVDRFLRFTEVARAGMALRGSLTLPVESFDAEQLTAATVLLVLGLRSLRAVGGDRRRGLGSVAIDIEGVDWDNQVSQCLDWAEANEPATPPTHVAASDALLFTDQGARSSDWVEIPLTVTTIDPVRAPKATLGNVVTGHDHIPGTTMFAWLLRTLHGNPALRAALTSGSALITPATPDIGGHPGVPVPAAFRAAKHATEGVLHNAFRTADARGKKAEGWVAPEAGAIHQPDKGQRLTDLVTHNVITIDSGTPTGDDGGVFTVEVIPACRVLRAVLRVTRDVHDALGQGWERALDGEARMGSAAKSEYGRVAVVVGEPGPAPGCHTRVGELTVWARTDVLVRDRRLRYSGDVTDVVATLEGALGVGLELVEVAARDVRVDSWQRSWQLPRPSLVGLAAGASLLLRPSGPIAPAVLAEVAAAGIGDRRGEGFGQVALNHPLLDEVSAAPRDSALSTPASPIGQTDAEDDAFLQVVREAALHAVITADLHQLPEELRDGLARALSGISSSQVGEIRQAVTLTVTTDGAALTDYLDRAAARAKPPAVVATLRKLSHGREPGLQDFADNAATRVGLAAPSLRALRDTTALLVLDILADRDAAGTGAARPVVPAGGRGGARSVVPSSLARPKQHRDGRGLETDAVLKARTRVRYRPVHTRWELTATLVARTPLHIGGSHDDPYVDLAVARDGAGAPYVPGTSLAGVLRAWAVENFGDTRVAEVFGGLARRDGKGDADFLASLVEVADAPLTTPDGASATTAVRDGVGIDRVRGAAAHRIKYEREIVPAGVRFLLRVRVEDVEPADELGDRTPVGEILRALQRALRKHEFSLGAAGSRGLGVVAAHSVTLDSHSVSTRAGVLNAMRTIPVSGPQPGTPNTGPPAQVLRIEVVWEADGPLMVASSQESPSASKLPLLDNHPDDGQPVPVLPGSSVKGVFSAEVERSLRTLLADDPAPSFVAARADLTARVPVFEALFGSQERKGALSIPDTYAASDRNLTWAVWNAYLKGGKAPANWLETTHVAIDRWTGGAAESFLYTVLEPHGVQWGPLRFDIDTSRVPTEHLKAGITLLLYAIAGFAAGTVPLGHGTHRGMGGAHATSITLTGAVPDGLPTGSCELGDTPRQRREAVLSLARRLWDNPGEWTQHLVMDTEEKT